MSGRFDPPLPPPESPDMLGSDKESSSPDMLGSDKESDSPDMLGQLGPELAERPAASTASDRSDPAGSDGGPEGVGGRGPPISGGEDGGGGKGTASDRFARQAAERATALAQQRRRRVGKGGLEGEGVGDLEGEGDGKLGDGEDDHLEEEEKSRSMMEQARRRVMASGGKKGGGEGKKGGGEGKKGGGEGKKGKKGGWAALEVSGGDARAFASIADAFESGSLFTEEGGQALERTLREERRAREHEKGERDDIPVGSAGDIPEPPMPQNSRPAVIGTGVVLHQLLHPRGPREYKKQEVPMHNVNPHLLGQGEQSPGQVESQFPPPRHRMLTGFAEPRQEAVEGTSPVLWGTSQDSELKAAIAEDETRARVTEAATPGGAVGERCMDCHATNVLDCSCDVYTPVTWVNPAPVSPKAKATMSIHPVPLAKAKATPNPWTTTMTSPGSLVALSQLEPPMPPDSELTREAAAAPKPKKYREADPQETASFQMVPQGVDTFVVHDKLNKCQCPRCHDTSACMPFSPRRGIVTPRALLASSCYD